MPLPNMMSRMPLPPPIPSAPQVQGICPCGNPVLEGTPVVLHHHGFRYCQSCLDKGIDKQLTLPVQGQLNLPERK